MSELNIQRHEDLGQPPEGMVRVRARVENYYINLGDEIVTYPVWDLPLPPVRLPYADEEITPEVEDWLQEHLFSMTGTGRTKGDATYDLEVIESSHPGLIPFGFSHQWGY